LALHPEVTQRKIGLDASIQTGATLRGLGCTHFDKPVTGVVSLYAAISSQSPALSM